MPGAADQDDEAPTPDPSCEDQDLGTEPEALVHPWPSVRRSATPWAPACATARSREVPDAAPRPHLLPLRLRRELPRQPGDLHLRGHLIAPEGCCPNIMPEAEAERWRQALLHSTEGHRCANGAWWAGLLARERVVLTCSCWRPDRCVRLVLAQVLARMGATYGGEETVGPLLPPPPPRGAVAGGAPDRRYDPQAPLSLWRPAGMSFGQLGRRPADALRANPPRTCWAGVSHPSTATTGGACDAGPAVTSSTTRRYARWAR